MLTRDLILRLLKREEPILHTFGVRSVGLFGSFAHNEAHSESDIDLLVDFYPEEETFDNLMRLCDHLEALFPDRKVDVVTKNGLSPYIGPRILEDCILA